MIGKPLDPQVRYRAQETVQCTSVFGSHAQFPIIPDANLLDRSSVNMSHSMPIFRSTPIREDSQSEMEENSEDEVREEIGREIPVTIPVVSGGGIERCARAIAQTVKNSSKRRGETEKNDENENEMDESVQPKRNRGRWRKTPTFPPPRIERFDMPATSSTTIDATSFMNTEALLRPTVQVVMIESKVTKEQTETLLQAHRSNDLRYGGENSTLAILEQCGCEWDGMQRDARRFCQKCVACQKEKAKRTSTYISGNLLTHKPREGWPKDIVWGPTNESYWVCVIDDS